MATKPVLALIPEDGTVLKRALLLTMTCVFFQLGCAKKESNSSAGQSNSSRPQTPQKVECTSSQIPNEYIAQTVNGEFIKITGSDHSDLSQQLFSLSRSEDILSIEPNFKLKLEVQSAKEIELFDQTLSTANKSLNWNVNSTLAPIVWEQGILGQGVIVAVIDTGVDIQHTQLKDQLLPGWNFVDDSPNVTDEIGHGSHIAGTIAAAHVSNDLPKGFAPQSKVLPLQFIKKNEGGGVFEAIQAIEYAVKNKAKVINASWGSGSCSPALNKVIKQLEKSGVLFIAAAGNDGVNISEMPEYPAAFNFPSQITVGATAFEFLRTWFSNYGPLVHVAAPGKDIISTYKNGKYAILDGTSMAAPAVAGQVALLWSAAPFATLAQVRTSVFQSVNSGIYGVLTKGQINVDKSVDFLKNLITLSPSE